MFSRTVAVVSCSFVLFAACGGEDGDSGPVCTGMEMSMPGSANDPCQQDDPVCTQANGKAYAMCVDGKWESTCKCVVMGAGGVTMTPPSTPMETAQCGDGVVTAPTEACDGTNLNGASCASLGFMGGGMLLCNPTTCKYDMLMCRMTTGTASGGAGMSGGAGSSGGAGQGS